MTRLTALFAVIVASVPAFAGGDDGAIGELPDEIVHCWRCEMTVGHAPYYQEGFLTTTHVTYGFSAEECVDNLYDEIMAQPADNRAFINGTWVDLVRTTGWIDFHADVESAWNVDELSYCDDTAWNPPVPPRPPLRE